MVHMWVQLKRSCVWVLQRGHSGNVYNVASTLCKYDLRKRDLFVQSWAMIQRVSLLVTLCGSVGMFAV